MDEAFLQQVKDWVADPTKGPVLHDLLYDRVAQLITALADEPFAASTPYATTEHIRRIEALEDLTRDLGAAAALVSYWGSSTTDRLVPGLIGRLANALDRSEGQVPWLTLYRYPAQLVMYAGGLGAVIGSREHLLADILAALLTRGREDWKPNLLVLHSQAVIDHDLARRFPALERRPTPVSDHLAETLQLWLNDLQPDQAAFERAFDRFEYLLGLVMFDLTSAEGHDGWAPVGRFSWRGRYGTSIDSAVEKEVAAAGTAWPLFRAGLFGDDVVRLAQLTKEWGEHIRRVRNSHW